MNTTIRFIFIPLILFVLVSCSSRPSTAIFGKWQSLGPVGTGDIMEFTTDGKFVRTSVDESKDKTVSGSFVLMDENRIKINFEGKVSILAPQVCRIAIKDDTLHWTNPNGETEDFKKSK